MSNVILKSLKKAFDKLTKEEEEIFKNLVKISHLSEFASEFPELVKIPKKVTMFNIDDIRNILKNRELIDRIPDFLEIVREKKRMEDLRREEERKRREQEELNKSYYKFWHYRGTVYGAKKYKKRSGDTVRIVTEFFLQRSKGDEHVVLDGYDLPIANGQDVCVVYGCGSGENRGRVIQYINLSMRKSIGLEEHQNLLKRKVSGLFESKERLTFELNRYISKL